jgi:hypothetical protein
VAELLDTGGSANAVCADLVDCSSPALGPKHPRRYLQTMPHAANDPGRLSYGEVRAALTRRADFESYQEGVGKSPTYVLNVRPHSSRLDPFAITGADLNQLLRDALARLTNTQ